jgi:hypothetical protein
MADIPPNIPNVPGGAIPPKKETGKVQPKKETVRITLPPKPSTAPTIKLPTLPPGGPTGAAGAVPLPIVAPLPAARSAPIAAPPPQRATAAPVAQQRPAPAAPKVAPAAAPTVGTFDKILAIAAAIAGVAAIVTVIWMWLILKGATS